MKKLLSVLLMILLLTAAAPEDASAELRPGSIDIPAFSVEDRPYRNLIDAGIPVDRIVAAFKDVCQWERVGNVIRMGDLECSSVEFYTGNEDDENAFIPMTLADGVWSCTLPEGCEVVEDKAAFWCATSRWFGGLRLDGSLGFLEPVYDAASNSRLNCYREDGMLVIYQEEYKITPEGWDDKMHRWYTNTYNAETGELYLQQVSDGGYTTAYYDVNGRFVYMEDLYDECCYIAGEGWVDSWLSRNPIAEPDYYEGYDGSTFKAGYPPHMPWLSENSDDATDTDLPVVSVELPTLWMIEDTYDNFADSGFPIDELVACFEGLPNWKRIGNQISMGDMGCSRVRFYTGERIPDEEGVYEDFWVSYDMTLTDGIWRCTLPEGSIVVEDEAYFEFALLDEGGASLSLSGEVWELMFRNMYAWLGTDGYIWCNYIAQVEGAAPCDYMDYYDPKTGAYLGSEVSERWDYTDQAFYDANGELVYALCFYGEYFYFIPGDGWRDYYPDGPRVEPPNFMQSYTEDYFKCLMPCRKPSVAYRRPVPSTWDAVLPDGLTTIESKAFLNTDISTLYIPDGVTSVAVDAFSGCDLAYIRIPGSLTDFSGLLKADVIIVPEGSSAHRYLKDREIVYVLE